MYLCVQFYDGNVSPATGTSFTVTPKSYFSGASAGSTLSLGFQLTFAGATTPSFTALVLNTVSIIHYPLITLSHPPPPSPETLHRISQRLISLHRLRSLMWWWLRDVWNFPWITICNLESLEPTNWPACQLKTTIHLVWRDNITRFELPESVTDIWCSDFVFRFHTLVC